MCHKWLRRLIDPLIRHRLMKFRLLFRHGLVGAILVGIGFYLSGLAWDGGSFVGLLSLVAEHGVHTTTHDHWRPWPTAIYPWSTMVNLSSTIVVGPGRPWSTHGRHHARPCSSTHGRPWSNRSRPWSTMVDHARPCPTMLNNSIVIFTNCRPVVNL